MVKITQAKSETPDWASLIKEIRTEQDMTQADFGAIFGVSDAAVSQWESGKRDAPYEVTWYVHLYLRKVGRA